jgi:hypothetical protein
MVADRFNIHPDALAAFCRKWKITELALFGSVLREDFSPDSDVDVLVVFSPDSSWTLLDVIGAEEELGRLFGRSVDLVEKQTVEQSENPIRRDRILTSARTIYAG